jgi:predicted ATP-dependent endonuclease of OLD family
MKLAKVIIKNFRGYSGEHVIDLESDLTALVGKNDAGKSTILEGLEIFFGDNKPELEDLNIHCTEKEIAFGCIFDDLPNEVTVDTSAKTTLDAEYLVNEDGQLEIIKRFTCTEKTIASKPEILLRALHPTTSNYDDILKLKLAELKARGAALGVTVSDQRVNSLWRKAIWENAGNLEARKSDLKVDEFDSKVKAIYTSLEAIFPQYYIFRVDRQTSDSDSEAKDPMQLAVKEAQKEFQEEITVLQTKIQQRVDEVAARALEKLHEMDATLASQLNPVLKSAPKWAFDYKIQDDRGVSINKRGSGTRRLVLLNFFRAEAERKSSRGSGSIIYAIEEPETSQHPNNQKLVVDSLLDLAADGKRQVIITTHSPQLLEQTAPNAIRFVEFDNTAKNVIMHTGDSGLAKAADSLGMLSNQKFKSAKAVVIVEGESDEIFLNHASTTLAASGHIASSLEDAKILVLPAGSSGNIPFWVQKLRLEALGLPFAIFMDSDRLNATNPPTINEQKCIDMCAVGHLAHYTRKREIENYIEPPITGATYGDYDDAKKIIARQNRLKPTKVTETYWKQMTSPQIIACSTYTENGTTHIELVDILNDILAIV